MKELCRINTKSKNSKSFKVVVEIEVGINKEVIVEPYQYDNSNKQPLFIMSGGLTFDPKSLTVKCSDVSVPEVLLHIELCKFVMDSNPELREAK
jgi:hypothetical protein